MAFPFQKQEVFFEGHIQAFHVFSGVPSRIAYDNLKTAVYRILAGRKRQEHSHSRSSADTTCAKVTITYLVRLMKKVVVYALVCVLYNPCLYFFLAI